MTREECIEWFKTNPFYNENHEPFIMATEALKEQKTGKWIGNEFGECSACGHKGCASDIWDRCEKHYCPNCGTLLEEEQ